MKKSRKPSKEGLKKLVFLWGNFDSYSWCRPVQQLRQQLTTWKKLGKKPSLVWKLRKNSLPLKQRLEDTKIKNFEVALVISVQIIQKGIYLHIHWTRIQHTTYWVSFQVKNTMQPHNEKVLNWRCIGWMPQPPDYKKQRNLVWKCLLQPTLLP